MGLVVAVGWRLNCHWWQTRWRLMRTTISLPLMSFEWEVLYDTCCVLGAHWQIDALGLLSWTIDQDFRASRLTEFPKISIGPIHLRSTEPARDGVWRPAFSVVMGFLYLGWYIGYEHSGSLSGIDRSSQTKP
jgi:hypothetical protein